MTSSPPGPTGHHRTGTGQEPSAGLRRFTALWARAVHPRALTSLPVPEFEAVLLPLARRLADALGAARFDPAPGRAVGAALVDARCPADALPSVLGVIDSGLVAHCGPPPGPDRPAPEELRARCTRLQHAVSAGFARALQERTRTEQEAVSRAALAARTEMTDALHESEARFRAVFKGAALGIGIADMDGTIIDVNDALGQMFGSTEEQVRSRNVLEWASPDDRPEAWRMLEELMRGTRDHYQVEKSYHRSDGTMLWTNLTVSLLRDPAGGPRYLLAMMEDVTERRLLTLRLRYQATHDALTDLPNRSLFFERLEQALDRGGQGTARIGLCYLDLDGFKAVNDSLGHAVGDQLLIAVAERLQRCASGPGQLLARIGGDEFVALVIDPPDRRAVTDLAERALDALSSPVEVGGRELLVRASIGVVEGPARHLTSAEVLRSADITMYRAKAEGGNRYAVADPDSDARAISRHHLTHHLPAALKGCEFFIEYQPLVRMGDGSLEGAEALVRWSHPRHGVLGPDRFIPLAEHTGLIVPLGQWVLKEAVRQACQWQVRGIGGTRPLKVNVNLSPRQLHHPDLVDDTVTVLEESGLDPSALCLEVTETAMVSADESELRPLRELAEYGVGIALDDFGTGYSNLANLRRLPASTLKLDRSFTQGLQRDPADPVDLKIVEGIVSLAHTLQLSVTVEGVETSVQAEQLRDLGCDSAQGWYYARPGPPERLPEAV
ncbi:putative bifunctional diguanylate cyclase/phosphodiesterase [Streptomyces marincola]|uniref:putative bifunctional diguanylate cyclase/phosphodiesterase n=1 Tax=Streptomyces marincola TaxID=2878388 RepID=UPI00384FBAA9